MVHTLEIEDIEGMRRQAGIDDVELREAIRGLRVGDHVRLTFQPDATQSRTETTLVRITGIRGGSYKGQLAETSALLRGAGLCVNSAVGFRSNHIHSVARGRAGHQ